MPLWLINIDENLSHDTSSNIHRENMIIYPINMSNNRNDIINNDLVNIVRYFDIIFNVFDETE
jgi:hypothetical protein